MIQIPEHGELQVGDNVKVTCSIKVENLEKQADPQ